MCGSAWQDRGVETIADQFQRYSGLVPTGSDNNPGSRVSGLQLCHDFLRWEKHSTLNSEESFYDIEKANWIFRNYGADALARYRSQFLDEPEEDNLPKIQFFDHCNVIIDTIPIAVYDDKKKEDIKEFDGDDPLDNLKYFCRAAYRYMEGAQDIMETQKKVQEAVEQLNLTADQTAFYRRMEKIERTDKKVFQRRSRFARH